MNKRTLALFVPIILLIAMPIVAIFNNRVADNKELTRKLEESTRQVTESTQKASQLEHQLEEEQKAREDIQESLDSLQQELQNLKGENIKLQQDNEALSKELAARPVVEKTLYMTGTGYTAFDARMNGKGRTRTGTICEQGRTISVDPSVIPLGSKVQITSASYPQINGVYVAEDTGSAIKGKIIDIYFNTKSGAMDFGRRHDLVVKVLKA